MRNFSPFQTLSFILLLTIHYYYQSLMISLIYNQNCEQLLQQKQMSNYFTPEGEEAIRNFKYKGGNLSLSYQYLWSPLADLILKFTPTTIAPNTITVIGLLTHILPTIVLISQWPFGSNSSTCALILYGIGVFAYQTLDNVDGKQARKLQNGTPLGMIMDHGCDGLGIVFLSLGVSRIMCLDDFELILWVFSVGVSFGFYLTAWCQYYSEGVMILGKFNAVDDGIPIIWVFAFYSAIFGQDVWKTEIMIFGTKYLLNQLIAISIVFAGIVQTKSISEQSGGKFTKDIGKALSDLLHLVLITFAVYSINMHSNLTESYFIPIIISLAFTMAKTISYTLLCTVIQAKFQQWQPSVLIFGLSYPIYIFFGQNYLDPSIVVYSIAIFTILQYSYFVFRASTNIARVLNISIFSVFKPKSAKKQ